MTISYVGGAAAEAATLTLPAHQPGDLIIGYGWRNDTTVPAIPNDWNYLMYFSRSAGANRAGAVAFKIAASGSESFGTWTSSQICAVVIYRKANGLAFFSCAAANTDVNSTNLNYQSVPSRTGIGGTPGQRMQGPNGHFVVLLAATREVNSNIATPLSGFTNRVSLLGASVNSIAIHDSNGLVTSVGGGNVAMGSNVVGSTFSLLFDSATLSAAKPINPLSQTVIA